jgi:hypothetical protein
VLPPTVLLEGIPEGPIAARSVSYTRLAVMGGVTAGVVTGSYLYVKDFWWSKQKTTFRFDESKEHYALHLDKAGHFFAGVVEADFLAGGFQWSGIEDEHAYLYGGLISILFSTSVEMKDGYAIEHGFSLKDLGSGILGSSYPYLRHRFPWLAALSFKASYWNHVPKYFDMKDQLIEHNTNFLFMDNYGNQTFWWVLNAQAIAPKAWKPAIPSWLGIAIGARAGDAVDVIRDDEQFKEFQLYLSLDIDVAQFLPESGGFWSVARRVVKFIHFPSPAIRLTPRVALFGFYL